MIARNEIHGSGAVGVFLLADSWQVLHNDFTGLEAWDADVLMLGNENRVVCLSATDQVLDLGFDNTIVGCALVGAETAESGEASATSESGYLERGSKKSGYGW